MQRLPILRRVALRDDVFELVGFPTFIAEYTPLYKLLVGVPWSSLIGSQPTAAPLLVPLWRLLGG